MRMQLRTRFTFTVIFLLVILVGMILLVIEKREVRAVFNAEMSRGVLIAQNIAQLNLEPFLFWDEEGVGRNIEEQIDKYLLYVVFYDRYNRPFVANESIRDYVEIYQRSHLGDDVLEDDHYIAETRFEDPVNGRIRSILEIEVPIFAGGTPRRWGSIKIGLSLEEMHSVIRKTRLMLILIGLVGLLSGVMGAALLARRITDPLNKLVEGTVQISRGDFSQQISIDSADEIGDLARSFNDMSRQLKRTRIKMEEANKKLVQAEKLASIGRISASIAHEIRNPLTSVKLNIQKISESTRLSELEQDHLSLSQRGIHQIENFVKEMLNFTRSAQLNVDFFQLEQILDESVKMIINRLEMKKIELSMDLPADLPAILVDGDRLRQVILNILSNGIDAVEEGGRINISAALVEENRERRLSILIEDDGRGISEADWENIFEPFFTKKASGIGLGLANARKIIEQHGGTLKIAPKHGKGAAFEILIPYKEKP